MNLKYLKAVNFRNLKSIFLEPLPALNLFMGNNGQGKTNLLDSIAVASQLKPLRAIKQNSDLIMFDEKQARIEGEFLLGSTTLSSIIMIDPEGKKVRVNNKATRDSHALREKVALVSFVPEDLSAVTGGGTLRRKLLDQITASLYPIYTLYYRQYEKVLLQRNRLLKQPLIDLVELDSFTQILSQIAASLEKARFLALEQILPYYQEGVLKLSKGELASEINYFPSSLGDLKSSLNKLKAEERARKTTLLGPHLDDLEISLNLHPARFSASRGQARVLILALKMAQLQAIIAHRALNPILLLDDVVGELDPKHATRLLDMIQELQLQTFITTTHLSTLPIENQAIPAFHILNGSLGFETCQNI